MADSAIVEKINKLRKDRNAVILAHNYQRGEVQDIADYVGDSLGLSQQAAKTDADVIIFAGVHFMAETAKILSPEKTVVMPDMHAGCPMANMITAESLRDMKLMYPDVPVVAYVNTTADVKAESDWCCTSGNAVRVVQSVPSGKIIFIPDKYLGQWVKSQLPEKEIILWPGYCPTHRWITADDIKRMRKEHSDAEVIVHPECAPDVTELADAVLSTGGMCDYAKKSKAKEIIIGTEEGLIHKLKKENPDKEFYSPTPRAVCPNMKLTTLEKVLWALEDLPNPIEIPEEIRIKALKPIQRMLEIV